MTNLLTRKLELFGPLPDDDRRLVDSIVKSPRRVAANHDIIQEGDTPRDVHLIATGLACRYKMVRDANRQTMAFLVPGDLCDYYIFILREMDHAISVLTDSQIVDIPRQRILGMLERPALARAFWWMTLVNEATLREWLGNLGRRDADMRIVHLFCELRLRMESVGLAVGG